MKHVKIKLPEFTEEEKEMIQIMYDYFYDRIESHSHAVTIYNSYAYRSGEVSDVGDKYVNNKRYFEIKDAVNTEMRRRKELGRTTTNKIFELLKLLNL